MKKRLLVIEDSREYQLILKQALKDDWEAIFAKNGQEALSNLESNHFDLILVDVVLPDMSGLQICSFIKTQSKLANVPVILLTSKDSVEDKVKGFDCGADDYITKPFDFRELSARMKRFSNSLKKDISKIELLDLEIDKNKQKVFSKQLKSTIELTPIEYKLLICLSQRVDHVLSRSQLLDLIWSDDLNVSERTVDTHVSNLRKKLKGTNVEIDAVRGCGYRFQFVKKAA